MTRDEFKTKSDELFFQTKESFCQEVLKAAQPIFEQADKTTDKATALHLVSNELSQMLAQLSFEASCAYSEKLALLLFDQLSK